MEVNFENLFNNWGNVVCKSRGEMNRLQFQLKANIMYGDEGGVAINPPLQLNQWYHVVMVTEGTQRKFYLNGNYIGAATGLSLSPNNAVLDIGRDYWGVDEYQIGKMDELRIFIGYYLRLRFKRSMNCSGIWM